MAIGKKEKMVRLNKGGQRKNDLIGAHHKIITSLLTFKLADLILKLLMTNN